MNKFPRIFKETSFHFFSEEFFKIPILDYRDPRNLDKKFPMVEHRSVIEIQISRIISRQISFFDGTGKNFPRIIEIIDSRQCRFLGKFYFSLETLAKFPNNGIFVPSSN